MHWSPLRNSFQTGWFANSSAPRSCLCSPQATLPRVAISKSKGDHRLRALEKKHRGPGKRSNSAVATKLSAQTLAQLRKSGHSCCSPGRRHYLPPPNSSPQTMATHSSIPTCYSSRSQYSLHSISIGKTQDSTCCQQKLERLPRRQRN